MFAAKAAKLEQPRFRLVQLLGREGQLALCPRNLLFGLVAFDDGPVHGRQRFGKQGVSVRDPLQPTRRLAKL
jgi:hypothetical protein